ncbi:hypothetical protein THRCLA_21534 [Thraustotheca clavata]|uniref:VPS9 domain-containing protein n=1 Tax=Thraustotheca clavata TaxID=74557 RepID=A0A1V9ZVE0_9STRA|nr:hypothetical protein THRCLA_21534 [Thraustotheca clavata]
MNKKDERSNQDEIELIDEKDKEIDQLRRRCEDLEGALKARDLEIAALREHNEILLSANNKMKQLQQFSTTGAPNATKALEQYTVIREACLMMTAQNISGKTPHEMLKTHLDSMGFEGQDIVPVVEALQQQNPQGNCGRELELLNSALDQLLYPAKATIDKVDIEFKMSELASSGYLIKPERRKSGRLSVSDFGLLESEHSPCKRRDSDPLFAGFDDSPDIKEIGNNKTEELTYAGFLERLSLPGSHDIVDSIRRFLGSVLGPRGDGVPPTSSHFVDYTFYGHENFQARCRSFFQGMDEMLLHHPAWRLAPESVLIAARDGIEKYIMDKLADIPLNRLALSSEWKAEDAKLLRRMQSLSFITPDMLDIKPCMRNEVVWSIAQDELRRINAVRSPGDKIHCIVRCCSIIFSVLNLSRGDSLNRPGADDFLPVFIYIVLHSQIPGLYSNAEYIAAYRNPADLMSKAGYCYVNLRSAIEFIMVLEPSMLTVDPAEFNTKLSVAEADLDSKTVS